VALALAGTCAVNRVGMGSFSMQLSATHVGVAVLFSTGVGLFFGWYPAKRASRLLPIECLRQE
jgi:putative ABC transport system permease protein